MRTPTARLLPLAAVAASWWLASCQRADSILLVEVAGDATLMPVGFAVAVTPARMTGREIRVAPQSGAAVSLPASFTIQLPGDVTGPVTVAVDAVDANGATIAQGTATQENLNVGGQTILTVTITAGGNIGITTPMDAGYGEVDAHAGTDAGSDATPQDAGPTDAAANQDGGVLAVRAAVGGGRS